MKKSMLLFMCLFMILSFVISACGYSGDEEAYIHTMVALGFTQTAVARMPAAETTAPTPEPTTGGEIMEEVREDVLDDGTAVPTEITHTLIPGEPGMIDRYLDDNDASETASDHSVIVGDDYTANLWERPFTKTDMDYRPDIDIDKSEISSDNDFFYVTIYLNNENPDGGLHGTYGIEIDIDKDGRGDLLVSVQNPKSDSWDIAGVSVYSDNNNDVGGFKIMRPETSYIGDGYETIMFSADVLDDPDAAWARTDQGEASVTLAFKKSLLGAQKTFVWGVWAAESLLDPAMLDLHDHFTEEEAGTPYLGRATYPIKAINLVDNTCREPYGFTPTTSIPGLCPEFEHPMATFTPRPTFTPQPTFTNTPSPSPTPIPALGSISYIVFFDANSNAVRDDGESLFDGGNFTVNLHQGSCGGTILQSSGSNSHTFGELAAGNYCITFDSAVYGCSTPEQFNFSLPAGGSGSGAFGVVFN